MVVCKGVYYIHVLSHSEPRPISLLFSRHVDALLHIYSFVMQILQPFRIFGFLHHDILSMYVHIFCSANNCPPHQLHISAMLVLSSKRKASPLTIPGVSSACARSFSKCWDVSSDSTLADLSEAEVKRYKQDNAKSDEERWWYAKGFAQGIQWLHLNDAQKAIDDAYRMEDAMNDLDRSCLEQRRPFMESTSFFRGLTHALQVDGASLKAKRQAYALEVRPDEDIDALDLCEPPRKRPCPYYHMEF